jgi:hypothetical protein
MEGVLRGDAVTWLRACGARVIVPASFIHPIESVCRDKKQTRHNIINNQPNNSRLKINQRTSLEEEVKKLHK